MGKVSKSTKRFSQNHLKDAIQNRKTAQKIKFREKKKWGKRKTPEELEAERKAKEGGEDEEEEEEEEESGSEEEDGGMAGKKSKGAFKGNVDDFLEKGFFDAMSDDDGEEDGDDDDDDDGDDDDEDGEDGSDDDEGDDDEEEKMKQEMEALKSKDPEFMKYLEENDPELLKFGEEEEDEEGEEEEGGAGAGDDGEEDAGDKGPKTLTMAMISGWVKQLEKGDSFQGLRDMVRAFESACHIDSADDQASKLKKGAGKKGSKGEDDAVRLKFRVLSGQVFERLMRVCITKMHIYTAKYLEIDPNPQGDKKINPQSSPRWKKSSNVVKAYCKSVIGFTETLTDPVMIHMMLRNAERMIPYIRPFPKLARKLLKVVLRVFGLGEDNRVQAFVVVRRLSLEMPHPFIEACFKGLYLTYVRQVKFTNVNVYQGQLFMAQCVVELFGLDMNVAYEHAFVYIRQLAIQLRTAMTATGTKRKEADQAVSCWQFVNSLCLWARVLSSYPGEDQLYALVYPYVQVALGVLKHINAPKYYPMRLKICSALIRVGFHAKVWIPLAPFYLDILTRKELYKTSNKGGDQPFEWDTTIKVSKQVLASRLYQEGAFEETLKGILIYLSSACYSPAFPEIIFQVVTTLRQFAKATTVNRFRRQAKDLVDKLERNATWVKRARLAKGVAPGKGDLNCLRPSDNNVASGLAPLHQIYLQSSQQAGGGLKDLLEARNMSVKGGDKAQEDDDDDDDDDEEGGDESEDDDDDGDEDATKKDEPRWKQAKREKRARMRAEKKAAKRKAAGDGNQEQQPAKKKKATPAKKKTAARGEDHGEDQVEDLELSDDE